MTLLSNVWYFDHKVFRSSNYDHGGHSGDISHVSPKLMHISFTPRYKFVIENPKKSKPNHISDFTELV